MELTIRLTGTRPMLMHNGRLADPTNQYTRRLKQMTGKRSKTDDDLIEIMRIEARGACWETDDEELGVPSAAIWRCLYDAAKAYKLGEDVKRGLLFDDESLPLLIDGKPVKCDEFLREPGHIDYRPVKIMGKKTMRARPRIGPGWSVDARFELLDDVMNGEALVPVIERAGRLVGLGDWRPIYGRFGVEVV